MSSNDQRYRIGMDQSCRHAALIVVALSLISPACRKTPNSPHRPDAHVAVRAAQSKHAAQSKPAAQNTHTTRNDPRSRLPLIDSHVHITPLRDSVELALRIFTAVHVVKFAAKSAGSYGSPRYRATRQLADALGDRMAFFINLDWTGIDDPGWGKREADALERAMHEGASGLKIFKALGLGVRLRDGSLLEVDDRRLDPIFERAAKTGAIIAWHVADPVAFFKPPTPDNERYEELSMAPDWSFYGKDYPSWGELMAARDRVLARHPKTIFLGIHLAGAPEDLGYVARILDRFPNLYVDVAARIPEIGHHPADEVRRFFIRYQDRILFGTDLIVDPHGLQLGSVSPTPPSFNDAIVFYQRHRRFFETADRQFDHPTPIQGRWKIDGINLPLAVLKKVYSENAERLIFVKRTAYVQKHAKPATHEAPPPSKHH